MWMKELVTKRITSYKLHPVLSAKHITQAALDNNSEIHHTSRIRYKERIVSCLASGICQYERRSNVSGDVMYERKT